MERTVGGIEIEPIDRGIGDDPMPNLKRTHVRHAEVDTLTQPKAEWFSILIQLATGC